MSIRIPLRAVLGLTILAAACDSADDFIEVGEGDKTKVLDENGKADASAEAVFIDMEFDGELEADFVFSPASTIEDQLLYTIGHLNGDNSVGRIDKLQLSNIQTTSLQNGRTHVSYHAVLPVAWGDKDSIPTSYTFELPLDMSFQGTSGFAARYGESCVDFSQAHDVDSGNMWYYYRPEAFPCQLRDEDILVATADISLSANATTGKFPEYHKIWEDDVLKVVAVFGKNEASSTSNFDAGISAYNRFVRSINQELTGFDVTTTPASIPTNPGVGNDDIEWIADIGDGKTVQVNALLVDNVRTAGFEFNQRYEALSTRADLIAYNGHAGLGANIRALAQRGDWTQGQYAVVFMNGCDTYAYVDSALFDAHAAVNPGDTTGTQHVDVVTNAMPAFFSQIAQDTMALVRGLMRHDDPVTYEQMFAGIDPKQVVIVSGEEDNVFVPGGGGNPEPWEGMQESGSVSRNQEVRFETPVLEAGDYVFELDGTNDADLYVRVGNAPTTSSFDCRPFLTGSLETCSVELTSPAKIHVMVRGWANSSTWELVGAPE